MRRLIALGVKSARLHLLMLVLLFALGVPLNFISVTSVLPFVGGREAGACSYHLVEGKSFGGGPGYWVGLYVNGCGYAKAQVYSGTATCAEATVFSSTRTYQRYFSCDDGATTNGVYVGSARIAAQGIVYDEYSGAFLAIGQTRYHSAYEKDATTPLASSSSGGLRSSP